MFYLKAFYLAFMVSLGAVLGHSVLSFITGAIVYQWMF